MMNNLLAAGSPIPIAPSGGFTGFGTLGTVGSKDAAVGMFANFISSVIGVMTIIAFIWFVFTFIIGAISIISAGGDKAKLEAARGKIMNSIIGLVVTIVAIFAIDLIGRLLGVPDILNLTVLFGRIF